MKQRVASLGIMAASVVCACGATAPPENHAITMTSTNLQDLNDTEALLEEGRSHGLSEARLRASMEAIRPITDSLSFGEQPQYQALDRDGLRGLEPEIGFVVRSFAKSNRADLKIAGFQLLGLLDASADVPVLRAAVESVNEWERVEALRALGRMQQPEARAVLRSACQHSDPETRKAAEAALRGP